MSPQNIDVWYAIPTADVEKARKCFEAWRDMGYRTAALMDIGTNPEKTMCGSDFVDFPAVYDGYPWAVNRLCEKLINRQGIAGRPASIVVTGGDDIFPDPNKRAQEIAAEFLEHFPDTFGVMQPTGDRQGYMADTRTVAAERICGSPWMGAEFIRRMNGGSGPFWQGYYHFECDVEMKEVAEARGILWQRPDLTQEHRHWSYHLKGKPRGHRPEYLNRAHELARYAAGQVAERRLAGWPGSEPLAATAAEVATHG